MLEKLNWPSLKEHRNKLKLIMLYKIIHGYVHVEPILPLTSFQMALPEAITTNFCMQPATRTDVYKHSFSICSEIIDQIAS